MPTTPPSAPATFDVRAHGLHHGRALPHADTPPTGTTMPVPLQRTPSLPERPVQSGVWQTTKSALLNTSLVLAPVAIATAMLAPGEGWLTGLSIGGLVTVSMLIFLGISPNVFTDD